MSLIDYAKSELDRIGITENSDEYTSSLRKSILGLITQFSDAGHSGFSGPYVLGILEKVMRFQPLSPLTGEDDEWNEVGDDTFQNERLPNVFKNSEGPYDLDGIVWYDYVDGEKCYFTNRYSHKKISFPYSPSDKIYLEWYGD